jgi:hypothetical protein
MRCDVCGKPAAYLINGMLYFCEDCRDDIGDEWNVITVEEIDNDNDNDDEWEA